MKLSDKGHPDVCNVFSYYETFVPDKREQVRDWCINAKLGCTDCKKELAQEITKVLAPIHEKRKNLLKDENKLRKILDKGRDRASDIAAKTRAEIKGLIKI
jgi:tryptophanyl-tRNA synthetase